MHILRNPMIFGALVCSIIVSVTAPLKAQGALDMGALTGSLSIDHVTQSEAARAANQQVFSLTPPAAGSYAANADFTFRNDRERTQQNLRTFVERTPVEAGRADLQNMITTQPTIIEEIGGAMRRYGLDPHNVADAYAMWWVNAWSASQKTNREPDRRTVAAVKQQARNAFAATPAFATTSDADRQEYAEALMLQAMLISATFEQNKDNPDVLDQLADAARKGAKASGLDLSLMTLTQDGFVPRAGADASEAIGNDVIGSDADPKLAIATEQSDQAANDTMPTYLGYGAAALAGLGLAFAAGKVIGNKG